ncbi:MAG: GHMP family kinase ATP-binding protein [Promethearchaeota archaeon]
MSRIVFSRAPVRINDIGGWTDTWFYPNGAVFNFTINLYSHVRLQEIPNDKIRIYSENLDLNTEIANYRKIEYDGILDLLKAAVKRMEIETGLDIHVRADAPPGSGIGTSASVAVALIAALAKFKGEMMVPHEIAELAHKLETEELKLESGVQDQFAAAYGGINFMEFDYPRVKLSPVRISEQKACQIESQMILVYLSSRSSSEMHKNVIKRYLDGDKNIQQAFDILKDCAYKMKNAIQSNDLKEIGDVMNENWNAQKMLHPLMVNEDIQKLEKIAFSSGAIGFKNNGAGGGGSITILADIGKEYEIKKNLIDAGFTLFPVNLNFKGVQTWEL